MSGGRATCPRSAGSRLPAATGPACRSLSRLPVRTARRSTFCAGRFPRSRSARGALRVTSAGSGPAPPSPGPGVLRLVAQRVTRVHGLERPRPLRRLTSHPPLGSPGGWFPRPGVQMPPSRGFWQVPPEPGRSRLASGLPEQGVQGTRGRAPQPEPQHPHLPLGVLCCHPGPLPSCRARSKRPAPTGAGLPGQHPEAEPRSWWPPRGRVHPVPAPPQLPQSPTSAPAPAQGPRAVPPTLPALARDPPASRRLRLERPSPRRRPTPAAVPARFPVRSQNPEPGSASVSARTRPECRVSQASASPPLPL